MSKSKCCTCGYEWLSGRDGSHSCTAELKKTIVGLENKYVEVIIHATGGRVNNPYEDVNIIKSVIDDHIGDIEQEAYESHY
jgi:hypothetical protein